MRPLCTAFRKRDSCGLRLLVQITEWHMLVNPSCTGPITCLWSKPPFFWQQKVKDLNESQLDRLYWEREGGTCPGGLCDTRSFGIHLQHRRVYLLIWLISWTSETLLLAQPRDSHVDQRWTCKAHFVINTLAYCLLANVWIHTLHCWGSKFCSQIWITNQYLQRKSKVRHSSLLLQIKSRACT